MVLPRRCSNVKAKGIDNVNNKEEEKLKSSVQRDETKLLQRFIV